MDVIGFNRLYNQQINHMKQQINHILLGFLGVGVYLYYRRETRNQTIFPVETVNAVMNESGQTRSL